jgi:hypothetical protein
MKWAIRCNGLTRFRVVSSQSVASTLAQSIIFVILGWGEPMSQHDEIDRNYDFFQRNLSEYLKEHKGDYVLLRACAEEGFFPTAAEAYSVAIARFADKCFSIQEVIAEPVDLGFFTNVAH